ncbi:hypothetical protein MMC34_002946 [Xylographa carneopallida]|nr:hypothetical protein [Xylographa carneopallida]
MVSLWGSKNGETNHDEDHDEEQNGEGSRPTSRPTRREPDERTQLLPPSRAGFLDPDDPAVSPYNLWSVRALRYFSILFLIITFLWWVLLLVSIFVSPPMLHTRGSGFFDFSFTTLTAGILLSGILFFSAPSRAMEITSLIIGVFLIVDVIIITATARIRFEEGWVGIASVIWAALMAIYLVLVERVVAWGKKEEEERLTGRHETKRSLKEWLAVLSSTIVMTVMIAVVILLTATLILRARDASLEPSGDRWYVDNDKYEVHVACMGSVTFNDAGERNPTILVEAGEMPFEDTFDDWIYGAYQNGTIDRYCYWDRPGMAFSDNAPSPHSAGMSADALSEALAQAGEQGPWILVSAGIGGIYSRIFSARHVGEISGIFLIDAMHEDLLYKIASPSRGFLLWARGIISPLGWDRLPAALFKGRTREDRVYGRSAYQGGKFIKQQLQESLVANSLTKSEVSQSRHIQSKDTPLVVVSSGIATRKDEEWAAKQEDLTKITDNLVGWEIVNGAPHEVWRTFAGRTTLEAMLRKLVKA